MPVPVTAPAFPITYLRGTSQPVGTVEGLVVAVHSFGIGASRRLNIGLAADNRATAVLTIGPRVLEVVDAELLVPDARIEARGAVRMLSRTTPLVEVDLVRRPLGPAREHLIRYRTAGGVEEGIARVTSRRPRPSWRECAEQIPCYSTGEYLGPA